jgi:hypothetical protein
MNLHQASPGAHALCSAVIKCTNFLLEYNHAGLHEDTTNIVSDMGTPKIWVQDYFMLLFLREGTQSQSLRDNMRACGLSPIVMHMGDVVATTGGRKDHQDLR